MSGELPPGEQEFTLYHDPVENRWALRRRKSESHGMWTVLSWHRTEAEATRECVKVSGKPPSKIYR